ncbi:59 kDa protein [Persimmon virus B]|uniref:59 kDa protein n=1 Tax=Persimmon virus B TaxID=1493829 RepID=A0A0A8JCW9_9CLOS|nr:59 kDa protein [Persimmon virus B]BAQ08208.1 59 kDa protein [Persimmon virus B]
MRRAGSMTMPVQTRYWQPGHLFRIFFGRQDIEKYVGEAISTYYNRDYTTQVQYVFGDSFRIITLSPYVTSTNSISTAYNEYNLLYFYVIRGGYSSKVVGYQPYILLRGILERDISTVIMTPLINLSKDRLWANMKFKSSDPRFLTLKAEDRQFYVNLSLVTGEFTTSVAKTREAKDVFPDIPVSESVSSGLPLKYILPKLFFHGIRVLNGNVATKLYVQYNHVLAVLSNILSSYNHLFMLNSSFTHYAITFFGWMAMFFDNYSQLNYESGEKWEEVMRFCTHPLTSFFIKFDDSDLQRIRWITPDRFEKVLQYVNYVSYGGLALSDYQELIWTPKVYDKESFCQLSAIFVSLVSTNKRVEPILILGAIIAYYSIHGTCRYRSEKRPRYFKFYSHGEEIVCDFKFLEIKFDMMQNFVKAYSVRRVYLGSAGDLCVDFLRSIGLELPLRWKRVNWLPYKDVRYVDYHKHVTNKNMLKKGIRASIGAYGNVVSTNAFEARKWRDLW